MFRKGTSEPTDAVRLPSLEQQQANSELVMKAQLSYQQQAHPGGRPVVQETNAGTVVVLPLAEPLSTANMNEIYELPFMRNWHPRYMAAGGVAALKPV